MRTIDLIRATQVGYRRQSYGALGKLRRIFTITALLVGSLSSGLANADCDDSLSPTGSRDDVLVIVNDNAVDSCEVAKHYAQERGLGQSNILHVYSPSTYFVDWADYTKLRDQIMRELQARVVAENSLTAATCADSSYYCAGVVAQVRAHTQIVYLVLTKGVPTRIVGVPSAASGPNDVNPGSVDYYLRLSLVNLINGYDAIGNSHSENPHFIGFAFQANRPADFKADGRGMRAVQPAEDREMIVGRIDGLTVDGAKAVVDRTIAAEENGFYGTLYSDLNLPGPSGYLPSTSGPVDNMDGMATPFNLQYWRYQLGMFAEENAACGAKGGTSTLYLDNLSYASASAGKSPAECDVRMEWTKPTPTTEPADRAGYPSARAQLVTDAAIYNGYLNSQATYGESLFSPIYNWRKPGTACGSANTVLTCSAASNCSTSTDVMEEIDTSCVGVADGFIGSQFRSFPLSYFGAWPTGWFNGRLGANDVTWDAGGGSGDLAYLTVPIVRDDMSSDADNRSLWFRDVNKGSSQQCYAGSTLTSLGACTEKLGIEISSQVQLTSPIAFNPSDPQTVRVSFAVSRKNLPAAHTLELHIVTAIGSTTHIGPPRTITVPADTSGSYSSWNTMSVDVPIGTSTESFNYDGIRLMIRSYNGTTFSGEIGIDDIELTELTANAAITLPNPSFTGGHFQFSSGDMAASFTQRLNGVAFWGSTGHHFGSSFKLHIPLTLKYFLRGLPLGDAVWFSEGIGNGMLYGDPLYRPVAVRLIMPSAGEDGVALSVGTISGSALNGSNMTDVTTTYSVDYCPGLDFYVCDGATGTAGWQSVIASTELTAPVTDDDIDTINIAANQFTAGGFYTFRLSVTSENSEKELSQTFRDFVSVQLVHPTANSDGDSLTDLAEVVTHHTLPTLADSDGDGLNDDVEVAGMPALDPNDPLDPIQDGDGDGVPTYVELARGSDPADDGDTPDLASIYADDNVTSGGSGTATSPYSLAGALAAIQPGDELVLLPGTYSIEAGDFDSAALRGMRVRGTYARTTVLKMPDTSEWPQMNRGTTISNVTVVAQGSSWNFSTTVYPMTVESSIIRTPAYFDISGLWATCTFENNVILGIGRDGAGIAVSASVLSLAQVSTVIKNNSIAGFNAGVVVNDSASLAEVNIQNNAIKPNPGGLTIYPNEHTAFVYNILAGIPPVVPTLPLSNVTADPRFVQSSRGDLRLRYSSPGLNAGNEYDAYSAEPSPNGGRIDIGASGNTGSAGPRGNDWMLKMVGAW